MYFAGRSTRFQTLAALIAVFVLGFISSPASAQRLATTVHPEHYTLMLTPDLKAATFTGQETIDLILDQPSDAITLNALEISFDSVTVNAGGKPQTASVSLDNDKQQATFKFPEQLPAGKATLTIAYRGILNSQLRGFYLSKTQKRNYAVTQFESTDARRAFPCFDEPAMKASYNVTLVVDKGDTAISNTNILSDTAGPAEDKHTIRFATTPRMSTYLVAFLVGDFQCISGESDGVPIRACATPDKVQLGKFAVEAATYVLHYYDTYFGIKYPMPKLDMIAIPDFEAGAMENFGAITYRETDFLIDDKTASPDQKQNVALVVAHEMAHQWFGDMVTMQWWDNLWLNEGFATWMEHKPVNAWKPEWHVKEAQASELDGTLNYDAQRTTRTIRAKAETPDEINQMFDGIAYGKAGAVLNMVENYLGEETFRKGVHNYLAAHLYANATAEDFWNAQTTTSGKPIDTVMSSFVIQPGVPLLQFGTPGLDATLTVSHDGKASHDVFSKEGGKLDISQSRFYLSKTVQSTDAQSWTVPICLKTAKGNDCQLITASAKQTIVVPKSKFLYANAGGTGYYRSLYTPEEYAHIVTHQVDLAPTEKITLFGDQWALMRSGHSTVADYLTLASTVNHEHDDLVLSAAIGKLATVKDRIASDEDRDALDRWVRSSFLPLYDEVKTPKPTDTLDTRELRATLFGLLGAAKDPSVIAEAKEIATKFLSDQGSVDPTFARAALGIAVANGDAAFYDRMEEVSTTSQDPSLQTTALYSRSLFRDPKLVQRTLDAVADGKIRNQDSWILLAILLQSRDTRNQTWTYIQQNWDKVQAQFTTASGGRVVGATASFCDAEHRDQVISFFSTHKVAAADRALKSATDSINDCIDLRAAQEPSLKSWLAQNAPK